MKDVQTAVPTPFTVLAIDFKANEWHLCILKSPSPKHFWVNQSYSSPNVVCKGSYGSRTVREILKSENNFKVREFKKSEKKSVKGGKNL